MELTPSYAHEPKRQVCAVCCVPRATEPRHLTHGVVVHLCRVHSTVEFLRRDGGRAFVHRLTELWAAHGVLTARRREALTGHLRRVRNTLRTGHLPGSYAWRRQREEAERRFSTGEALTEVIRDVRHGREWGATSAPSVRTIRRWYAEARWLTPPPPKAPRLGAAARTLGDHVGDYLENTPVNPNRVFTLYEHPTPSQRRRRQLGDDHKR